MGRKDVKSSVFPNVYNCFNLPIHIYLVALKKKFKKIFKKLLIFSLPMQTSLKERMLSL